MSRFERNRFFHGKLMTARDMQAEQDYHVDRLNMLNRLVVGTGIVRGLNVTDVRDADDGLVVEVGPGVALDGDGRLIVVDNAATESLSDATGDEIHVFLGHEEASKDKVPVPGSDRSYEEDCTYNRIVETFEITYREDLPDRYGEEPEDGSPGRLDPDVDDESNGIGLARSYHRHQLEARGPARDSDVFLGSFERTSDGWEEMDGVAQRPYVYTNDMLYDVLVDHVTNRENPHRVSFEGADIESAGELDERMDELEQRVGRIEEQKSSLERYVMNETLEAKIRAFQHVKTEFNSGTAEEIVEQSRRNLHDEAITERREYLDFIETVVERETGLEHELGDEATSESLSRYSEALTELKTAIGDVGDDESVIAVAEAQKKVCEAAESLSSG
jgi:hypothetical protein